VNPIGLHQRIAHVIAYSRVCCTKPRALWCDRHTQRYASHLIELLMMR
jgi:hypothetical protein